MATRSDTDDVLFVSYKIDMRSARKAQITHSAHLSTKMVFFFLSFQQIVPNLCQCTTVSQAGPFQFQAHSKKEKNMSGGFKFKDSAGAFQLLCPSVFGPLNMSHLFSLSEMS